jgi:predicted esterase
MDVEFARRANSLLTASGLDVEYHEGDFGHQINPADVPAAISWLRGARVP